MRATFAFVALGAALLAFPVAAQETPDTVTIQVEKDLALQDFLDQMSKATGKAILYDPNSQRIRGQKLGASFVKRVPKLRVFDTFRAILAFYEITLVPVGPKGYEVYLALDSRSTNSFVKNRARYVDYREIEKYADKEGVFVSCAIPIRHIENLTTLRTALSTMVSPAGIGRVHEVPGSRSVIILDFAPNVAAMARLIRQMDVARESQQVVLEVIELEHAVAKELAIAINEALARPAATARSARTRVTYAAKSSPAPRVVAYGPRNALLVSAIREDYQRIVAIVKRLDRPAKQKRLVG